MKLRYGIAAAVVAGFLACLPNQAEALRIAGPIVASEIPYEFVVTEADTVVVATVVSVKKPEAPAGGGGGLGRPAVQPRIVRFNGPVEAKFKVESVIADMAKLELKDKEIDVTLGMTQRQAPNVNDKIVLAIKNTGENGKYYVLPYANAYMVGADGIEKAKKEFAKAGDLDKWNWGKESNGLRAVALVRSLQPKAGNGAGMVQLSLGLRNTTKESIFINTFPGDKCLTLRAWAEGAPITANLMNAADSMVYDGQNYAVEIKPGALMWISQWGPSAEGTPFSVQSVEGKFVMRASYKSSRENNGLGTKFWQGDVVAGEISAEMPKAPPTPVRGRPTPGVQGITPY